MCCGNSCGENLPLFNYLKERLAGNPAIRVNRAGCFEVCMEGPIMVVHPDGVWYCHLNEAAIDRIIDEHFGQGKVVEELAFHKAD
jgi:(2Fe-2S) ferredoxin